MNDERMQVVLRILAIRADTVDKAGYTAGAEGLPEDPEDLPDSFWERVERHYQLVLADEGLVDDLTPDEETAGLALAPYAKGSQ